MSDQQQPQQQGNQQDIGAGGVLLAFAIGAVVGAAAALLLAPATGEETRRAVNARTREGREKVLEALRQGKGLFNQRRQAAVDAFGRARERAQRGAERGPEEPEDA
jgi:gas vesicle protein